MSWARIAAIVAAASALWGGMASAGGPLRAFHVGLWSGGAYIDDRTGDFTHCSAGVAYDSGINMFILLTGAHRWWLGFVDPKWDFAPQVKMPVGLRLGGRPRLAMAAMVPNREVVLVLLPDDHQLIDRLRGSSELRLIAERRSFLFRLKGTGAVMAGLENCVRTSLALEAQAPAAPAKTIASAALATGSAPAAAANRGPSPAEATPPPAGAQPAAPPVSAAAATKTPPLRVATRVEPAVTEPAAPPAAAAAGAPVPSTAAPKASPPPGPASPGTNSAALDVPRPPIAAAVPAFSPLPQTTEPPPPATPTDFEEARLAQDFFTTAQLPNARLVVTNKPAALASFTAVWRSDNAAGAVKIIPPGPDVTGIGIASNLIAVDPQMCKGNFASAPSRAEIDNAVVFSAILSCTQSNEQRTAQYFITRRRKGGFVVFAVVGSSAVDLGATSDQQRIELLRRAAARAAGEDS